MIGRGLGILINRLTVGFVYAFIYQAMTGIATSVLSIPLTGTIGDLILGIEDPSIGVMAISWWAVSTTIYTLIASQLVKFRRYISPYKKENMNARVNITIVSLIILGATMSALFFFVDLLIGVTSSVVEVDTIYQAAMAGNFTPLMISITFSVIAGFLVVGIMERSGKVTELTRGVGSIDGMREKIFGKDAKTIADTKGMAPGEAVFIGTRRVEKSWFSSMRYDKDKLLEVEKTHDVSEFLKPTTMRVNWLNMIGVHDEKSVVTLGTKFGLHELRMADILNTQMRAALYEDERRMFASLKMPLYQKGSKDITIEHVTVILGPDYVLSFQEDEGDVFDKIRDSIRKSYGKFRTKGNDYLTYALIDAIIDNVFVILEEIGEKTEAVEDELMKDPDQSTLQAIYSLKSEIIVMRRVMWPMREVINNMSRSNSDLIHDDTKEYLQDVYNHAVQAMDMLESLRDTTGGMLDTYLSIVSNKTNDVMKLLTIIASIFIPITFIAGIYGTNFAYIPEVQWEGGYFVMLGMMGIISLVMVLWFRKKAWL